VQLALARETTHGERRVALVPESVRRLAERKLAVVVEPHAGGGALIADAEYEAAGATVAASREALWPAADVVVKIHPPSPGDVGYLRPGCVLVSLLYPVANAELVRLLAARGVTAVAVDRMPRTTLAQAMDVLSSQATVAGYHAVVLAAGVLPRFFPMLMTAAGTIAPARVLVLGAGVAGLQAIAAARRLGGVVEAFDVRRAVREQVESLGARFLEVELPEDAEGAGGYARPVSADSQTLIAGVVGRALTRADVCITTALVPGQRAPRLITADMVQGMRPGSVIVDLAAAEGGNCELTEPGQDVVRHGVTIMGPRHPAAALPVSASQMYSRNTEKLILHLVRDGALVLDLGDEITRGCVVTHGGEVLAP
jgi:NAD(P) transhydrogenase subunit alpha